MTVSCITSRLEKQIVLQAKRLGSDVEVFTLNLLGIALTHTVLLGVQVTFISPPVISVIAADVEGAGYTGKLCSIVSNASNQGRLFIYGDKWCGAAKFVFGCMS